MPSIPPSSLQLALQQSPRLRSIFRCSGQRSLVLGAALLLGSTLTVAATANTTPTLTNVTLSKSIVDEGESFTISGTIVDPDPGEIHTLYIYPGRPSFDQVKVELPAGQLSFQVPYTYTDDRGQNAPDGNIPISREIKVWVSDDNPPNDNDEEAGETNQILTIGVRNVAPVINSHTLNVTKAGGKSGVVVVEGQYTEPGLDTVQVSANWGDGLVGAGKLLPACDVNHHTKTFRCEHTYKPGPAKTYQITLRARDDDGGEDTATTSVQIL
jgi:hypothetical protein